MTIATATDGDIDAFIREFVRGQSYAHVTPEGLRFESEAVEQLFARFSRKRAGVLPSFNVVKGTQIDNWLIVGMNRSSTDALMEGVRRFIMPTYAVHFDNVPVFREFSLDRPLGQAARNMFAGYYRLVSRPKDRSVVLDRLLQCYALTDLATAPSPFQIDAYSYHSLYRAFQRALLTSDWDDAETTLEFIDSVNLTTAENVQFLRIEWLARQERWHDIWTYEHYSQLAQIPVPQPIRSAMLTAFHAEKLRELELAEKWDPILEMLNADRIRLAQLLSVRFNLNGPSVLRVFAYLAVLDADRDMFERVWGDVPPSDYQTRFILSSLKDRLPTVSTTSLTLSAQLQEALNNCDYESAWIVALDLVDSIEQTAALLQIAYLSQLTQLVRDALSQYDKLYVESQRLIAQRYPSVSEWISHLQTKMGIGEPDSIRSWADWFARAAADPRDPRLLLAIQSVSQWDDVNLGTPEDVLVLTRSLADISSEAYRSTPVIREAIRQLVETCLKDEDVSRSGEAHSDLIEYLLEFAAQDEQNNQNSLVLLQLQEAVLIKSPAQYRGAISRLSKWFMQPVPALRDRMLEGVELLVQFGAQPGEIYVWFREWAENLLASPKVERIDLEVWASFARWCAPNTDLLRTFEAQLAKSQGDNGRNLLTDLPDGFQIAIFSLDVGASTRARDILLRRNTALDVRICRELDNSKTVEQLARNAQLVILVTPAITHAISYAIKPLATGRLAFANARGATAVLRAVEDFLQH